MIDWRNDGARTLDHHNRQFVEQRTDAARWRRNRERDHSETKTDGRLEEVQIVSSCLSRGTLVFG